MANKKASPVSADSKSMKTGEFLPLGDSKESVSLETIKSSIPIDIDINPPTDEKDELRKAISDAVKHDAETSKFTSVKETKQRRRDIIFNTIMKHARNMES